MKATALAHANIAIVKFWGVLDADLNLPLNDSLSLTLDQADTVVTVEFSPHVAEDRVELDGLPAPDLARQRVVRHLDRLRALAHEGAPARVAARSTFPAATGLASSASLFAGLTVAGLAALGISTDRRTASTIARLGSGSAARSLPGGWAYWQAAARHEDSYAFQFRPADWWPLRDVLVIVSEEPKESPSLAGHLAAPSSPCHAGRLGAVGEHLALARTALEMRDLALLGRVAEEEALLLHAVAMTARPPALYWHPATVEVLRQVRRWREEGRPVYYTLDAGPNVHLLTDAEHAPALAADVCRLPGVQRTIVCQPGGPPVLGDVHLF